MESAIQSEILLYLKAKGYKAVNTMQLSKSGNADIIACCKGRYVEIEVKQVGKKSRELQLVKANETLEAGGLWLEAHSLNEVKQFLTENNL